MKLQFQLEDNDIVILQNFLKTNIQITTDVASRSSLERSLNVIDATVRLDTTVDAKVTNLLAQRSGIPASHIKNEHKLGFHLQLGLAKIRALAGPLTLIAQLFKSSASVSSKESEKLTSVQECIDLVKSKIV
jgi:hypothetical protein